MMSERSEDTSPKRPKFKFLRKGEGIARFKNPKLNHSRAKSDVKKIPKSVLINEQEIDHPTEEEAIALDSNFPGKPEEIRIANAIIKELREDIFCSGSQICSSNDKDDAPVSVISNISQECSDTNQNVISNIQIERTTNDKYLHSCFNGQTKCNEFQRALQDVYVTDPAPLSQQKVYDLSRYAENPLSNIADVSSFKEIIQEENNALSSDIPSKPLQRCSDVNTLNEGQLCKLMKMKLGQLESAIASFMEQNRSLALMMKETERKEQDLIEAMENFDKMKDKEINEMKEFKKNEMEKLKKQKKHLDEYEKFLRDNPNRTERKEIEELKSRVDALSNEMKTKETRWVAQENRLHNTIGVLKQERDDLRITVKLLESRRIELMKQLCVKSTSDKYVQCNITKPYVQNKSITHELINNRNLPATNSYENSLSKKTTENANYSLSVHTLNKTSFVSSLPGHTSENSSDYFFNDPKKTICNNMNVGKKSNETSLMAHCEYNHELCSEKNSSVCSDDTSVPSISNFQNVLDKCDDDSSTLCLLSKLLTSEKVLPNGGREILLNDGTRTVLDPSGLIITETVNGDKVVMYPDGRQETHTNLFKRKIYPHEKVVTEYKNGSCEVMYSAS